MILNIDLIKFIYLIPFILLISQIQPVLADHASSLPFILPDPILYYKFNNNVIDSIGNIDGEIIGNENYVDGINGKAIHFDGQNGVIIKNMDKFNFNTGLTISFWSKIPPNSNKIDNDGVIIVGKGSQFFFRIDPFNESPNRLAFFVEINKIVEPRIWYDYTPDTWDQWTVTWDGNILKLYRDGLLMTTQQRSGVMDQENSNMILGGNGFVGDLKDLKIYDKALTGSEVFVLRYGIPFLALEIICISLVIIVIIVFLKIRSLFSKNL